MITIASLPPAVRPGDRVGVAALSGPVEPGRLQRGMDGLRQLGFEPVPAGNLGSTNGLFAGDDHERLAAFHELAEDASLAAIFFARGGHGVLRLLERLDWDLLRQRPRAYVGYSDLTPFLLEVVRRVGIAAFHGPMVAADFARGLEPQEVSSLLTALAGEYPVSIQVESVARPAEAEGVLLGGCLSLLASTLGTPFFPDLEGALLVIEEVQEPLYRLDRMLTHLRLSGNLEKIRGMVLGHFVGSADEEFDCRHWRDLVSEVTAEIGCPVVEGLSSGHQAPNLTLPLGVRARLEPATNGLILGESG